MTALQDRLCKVPKAVLVMSALSSSVRRSVAGDVSECGAGSAHGGNHVCDTQLEGSWH